MALTKFEKDISYISKLADQPNDVSGGELSAADLKAKFDQAGNDIKEYINTVLIPEVTSDIEAAAEGVGSGGEISAEKLADSSITGKKLADGAVNTAKIADNAISTAKIADGAVGNAQLANDSVTADKLADSSVERNAIKDEAVSTAKLFAGAVTTDKLKDSSVTADKIAPKAVSQTYTATVPTSGWVAGNGCSYVDITVNGILATDQAFVDVDLGSVSGAANIIAAAEYWSNVFRIWVRANNGIRVFVYETPTMEIPVKLVVIRK